MKGEKRAAQMPHKEKTSTLLAIGKKVTITKETKNNKTEEKFKHRAK